MDFSDEGLAFQLFEREPVDDSVKERPASDEPYRLDRDVLHGKEELETRTTEFSVSFDGANRVSPIGDIGFDGM